MAKTKIRVKQKSANKRRRQSKKHPAMSTFVDKTKRSSRQRRSSNRQKLRSIKNTGRSLTQREIDFIKVATGHQDLKSIIQVLPKLGISLEEFLDLIKIEKFLHSDMNPKGTIFEVLLLKDKMMVNLLLQRSLGTLKDLSIRSDVDITKLTLNINKIPFRKADFDIEDFPVKTSDTSAQNGLGKVDLATNFNTIHKNNQGKNYPLLFSDFAIVKFNPKSKKLLIIIPGEIKEPSAAKELADQLAKIEDRLKNCNEISFDIGNNKNLTVNPRDVFVVRDNSLGIPRRKIETNNPRAGKDIKISSDVLEIVQVNSRDTKSDIDPQEMFRFLVKVKPEFDPEKITKALIDIKKNHLKLPHKG